MRRLRGAVRRVSPRRGKRRCRTRPPASARALAHARQPVAVVAGGRVEAVAVVGDAHDVPSPCALDADAHRGGAGVARHVRQALLDDAVDDDLLLGAEAVEAAVGQVQARDDAGGGGRSPRPCCAGRPRGRGRRAPRGAARATGAAAPPSPAWRPPASRAARRAAPRVRARTSPAAAAARRSAPGWPRRAGRGRRARARSSWAWRTALAVRSRSASRRSSIRVEGGLQAGDLLDLAGRQRARAAGSPRSMRSIASISCSSGAKRRRITSRSQHRRQERGDEHEQAPTLDQRVELSWRRREREDRRGDQQRVDGEDLGDESWALRRAGEDGVQTPCRQQRPPPIPPSAVRPDTNSTPGPDRPRPWTHHATPRGAPIRGRPRCVRSWAARRRVAILSEV